MERPRRRAKSASVLASRTLNRAFIASNELGHSYVGPEHLLIGLAEKVKAGCVDPAQIRIDAAGASPAGDQGRGQGSRGGPRGGAFSTPDLDQFSRDLTKLAREGKLDPSSAAPARSRRRSKCWPAGKEQPGADRRARRGQDRHRRGLAQRIVAGEVPEALRDKRLVELNINSMVAGSKYRGEFEERVQKILKEITEEKDSLILFIDEIHTIVARRARWRRWSRHRQHLQAGAGAGRAEPDRCDDAQRVPEIHREGRGARATVPAGLCRGTHDSSGHHDPAGLRDTLEAHHKVTITDEAIVAAAELDRYITGRFARQGDRPDRSGSRTGEDQRHGAPRGSPSWRPKPRRSSASRTMPQPASNSTVQRN